MEKQSGLVEKLAQLNPLIGSWTFKGSFKDNPDKRVEGWETYEVVNDGSALFCDSETITLWPESKDVYKKSMNIVFDEKRGKIVGGDEWAYRFENGVFSIQNDTLRFTGKINESNDTITGKWEVLDVANNWKYWYDKILTKK